MHRLSTTLLALLFATPLAAAQHIPPNTLPPPISPPLLTRPTYDLHAPAPSPQPEATTAPQSDSPPAFDTPESGLECTPGHVIVGCVQVPIFQERGPYSQAPRWPTTIPYEYDANVPQANRTLFDAAMNEVQSYCDVSFIPRQFFHTSWLHIQSSSGNNAPVGLGPGQRIVNILNFNVHYTMVHELCHVLGIYHEQSRTDRGAFVTINAANISQNGCQGNPCDSQFQIESASASIGIYNFDSFMHYSRNAFSINPALDTISVASPYADVWQSRIGQRSHATFGDRATTIFLYQPSWAKVAQVGGSNGPGSWANPFNNFPDAYNAAPTGGDVILRSGYFTGLGLRTKAMRLHAPDGGVRIGQ